VCRVQRSRDLELCDALLATGDDDAVKGGKSTDEEMKCKFAFPI